jgi:hypothetical protein
MSTFYYKRLHTMEPRAGKKYATIYIKQSHEEHARLLAWLTERAQEILDVCEHYPDMAAWFQRPAADFPRSSRRDFYTPEDILTDMIQQLSQGRDLPRAMWARWNRLTDQTPWTITMLGPQGQQLQVHDTESGGKPTRDEPSTNAILDNLFSY